MEHALTDPVPLARSLIRCPSVTPADAGALDVLERVLRALGFDCHRLLFATGERPVIGNLYARLGTQGPNFCFAGHTDVVPVGDGWTHDPFAATVQDGVLYGRGAADMKGAIACFIAAVARRLEHGAFPGSVSVLITGDEEGPAVDGTVRVLDWMRLQGETIDACLVGEPTNPSVIGEMIKIGRRGSMNGRLTVTGVQGHTAYPDLADNPIDRLVRLLSALTAQPLDDGSAHFQPSTLALTTVDVGNPATNVIPGTARAAFNIRFNDRYTPASLEAHLRRILDAAGGGYELSLETSGESFLTQSGALSDAVTQAIAIETGRQPVLSTSGGTSDARFIKNVCPVVEFGLVGKTIHKADECASLDDMETLTRIYQGVLDRFFSVVPA